MVNFRRTFYVVLLCAFCFHVGRIWQNYDIQQAPVITQENRLEVTPSAHREEHVSTMTEDATIRTNRKSSIEAEGLLPSAEAPKPPSLDKGILGSNAIGNLANQIHLALQKQVI